MSVGTSAAERAILIAAAGLVCAGSALASSPSTTINVTNYTAKTFVVTNRNLDYGRWSPAPSGMLPSLGQMRWGSESNMIYTGTEGETYLGTTDGTTSLRFYWDNPFIGSNTYRVDGQTDVIVVQTTGGPGVDAYVTFEIISRGPEYIPQDVPASGPGVISGTVRWRAAEGVPAFNAAYWSAFSIQAVAPRVFNALFSPKSNPPLAPGETEWLGRRGYFAQLASTGQLSCRPAAALPAGYFGFAYSITDLPTGVPVQLEVSILDSVAWPPDPSNVAPVGLISAQYKRGVVPVSGLAFTIWPDSPTLTGIDFGAVGAWVSQGGGGAGGVSGDAATIIAQSKTYAVNPSPIMGLRLLRPNMAVQRLNILRQPNNPRVLTNPRILSNPQLQVQPGVAPALRR